MTLQVLPCEAASDHEAPKTETPDLEAATPPQMGLNLRP